MVSARAALEVDLREAIAQGQFLLHYQAQVIGEGRLTGAEVLVRWEHPERGLVSPVEFIPLAEDTGLIPVSYTHLDVYKRQSTASSPVVDVHALAGIALVWNNLEQAVSNPSSTPARENMLLGSLQAGLAFSNASLGAVHALSLIHI